MATATQQLQQALKNGYSGPTVQKGNDMYTDYGALLRDGYNYPTGAKISPNGMYVDTGKGWQFAGSGSMAGAAPGSKVTGFDRTPSIASTPEAPAEEAAPTVPTTPEQKPEIPNAELEQWWKKLFGY